MDPEQRNLFLDNYLDMTMDEQVEAEYILRGKAKSLYLEGINLYDILDNNLLNILGSFLGYGQCYESAALAMYLLKDNPTAYLVCGTGSFNPSTGKRCPHAWVEFYYKGVPLVIDLAWFGDDSISIPRIIHVELAKSLVVKRMSYAEFWSMSFNQKIFQLMHCQKTSYILPWLLFHRSPGAQFEYPLHVLLPSLMKDEKYAPSGEPRQFMHFYYDIVNLGDIPTTFIPTELRYVL
ncbi:hypothetical protein IJ096_02810 [Candidatus Saccharibacteria bacterium]|nr:hypothetical protein [Candidatus Saccharibacteria bacterium]